MPLPTVENIVRCGNFTLYVYAYRSLTPAELKQAAALYLSENRLAGFPSAGAAKLFTVLGIDQATDG